MRVGYLLFTLEVGTILPNSREHHLGDPILKALGFRLVGAHDQLVEAGFADDPNTGSGTQSFNLIKTSHIVIEVMRSGGHVGLPGLHLIVSRKR